ncbi:type III secretion system inner membrane ring subunit SctD [Paludibacterium yongneupense]|uniref:type III secretion system inner membrane ring subunit SctD n=1 Tax=Paludibacterium yongneupense TaxID=400061 RepID=UPI00048FBA13|nr:type III secretion system inner membrane ring subunit SctD [Paludibacterium yongneupense]
MTDYLFRIRLLSGPLCGRELELRAGVFTIGGDDPDLDVLLDDAAVCRLDIDAAGVRLLDPLPCWIDGIPGFDGDCLPLGRVLDLAGLVVVLAAAGESIPPLRPVPRQSARRARGRVLVLWLLLAAVALALTGWAFSRMRVVVPAFDAQGLIAAGLRDPALAGVRAVWGPDGSVTLSGHCLDSARLAHMRDELSRQGVPLRDEVQCRDELVARVARLLNVHGYREAKVVPGPEAGTVAIRGDIRFDARWDKVAQRLLVLPGLAGWTVGNEEAGLLSRLAATLGREKRLDGVSAALHGNRLFVGARLPPARQQALVESLQRFVRGQDGSIDFLVQAIPPSRDLAAMLPAAVVAVGGDPAQPYLELANGMRLVPGAHLPGGYRVLALGARGLSLLGEDGLFYLPHEL